MSIKSLLVILLAMCPLLLQAQMVSGTVYEQSREEKFSLPAVNVYWAGSQIGTTTNADGKFEL